MGSSPWRDDRARLGIASGRAKGGGNPLFAPSHSKRKVPTGLSTFKTGGGWGRKGRRSNSF